MPVDLSGDPPYGLDAISRRLDEVLADLQRAADAGELSTEKDRDLDRVEWNFHAERSWLLSERRRRMADGRPFDDVNADIRALNHKLATLFSQSRRCHTRDTSIRSTLSGVPASPFEEELNRLERAIEDRFRPDEPDQDRPDDLIEDCEQVGEQIYLENDELRTRWLDASAEWLAVRDAIKRNGASHPDTRRLNNRFKELECIEDEYGRKTDTSNYLESRYRSLQSRIGEIWARDFPGDLTSDTVRLALRAEELIEERPFQSRSSSAQTDRQLEALVSEFDVAERKETARRIEEVSAGKDTSSTDSVLAAIARERAIVERALRTTPVSTRSIRKAPSGQESDSGYRIAIAVLIFAVIVALVGWAALR